MFEWNDSPSVRVLRGQREIDRARALLARVYCLEMGWRPRPGNPSDQRLVLRGGTVHLEDRFDPVATWVGAFEAGELVACARIGAGDPERCELELYRPSLPRPAGARYLEVNRLAIASATRGAARRIAVAIFDLLHELAVRSDADIAYCTTSLQSLIRMLEHLGFRLLPQAGFRYDDGDEQVAQVLWMPRNRFARVGDGCARRLGRRLNLAR